LEDGRNSQFLVSLEEKGNCEQVGEGLKKRKRKRER
jgi:hypothetical protein